MMSNQVYVNGVFSGGFTNTAKFSLYVSPYLVANQGGRYTKHIYAGSQRIVSKVGDFASYGSDPRRIEYAGANTDGLSVNYKAKYAAQQQVIKDNYKTFDVPYNGTDNDNYADGEGFCCNDGSLEAAQSRVMARAMKNNFQEGDSYEKMQFYYHPDHLGSSSYITNLDGEVVQHIEYVPFGEVFVEERNNIWNTPYLFNAKEFDEETGLYYYGARYYDPRVSLWISTDRFEEKYPNVTAYSFTANNPMKFLDINGDSLRIEDKKLSLLYISGNLYNQNGQKYDGKISGFMKKAVSALDVIRKGTEGENMISELQSSTNNFIIKKGQSKFTAANNHKAYSNQFMNDPSVASTKEVLLKAGIDLSGGSGGENSIFDLCAYLVRCDFQHLCFSINCSFCQIECRLVHFLGNRKHQVCRFTGIKSFFCCRGCHHISVICGQMNRSRRRLFTRDWGCKFIALNFIFNLRSFSC